jgi:branched-chain amino acid transport system ATP-binding protein
MSVERADDPVLRLQGVSKRFGGFLAVDGVSLQLAGGERRALIGPNGAGKTTLFNLISGRLKADGGEISYAGRPITRTAPEAICRLGVARTFQITSVFPQLSCLQNVQTSLFARHRRSHWLLRRSDSVDADEALGFLRTVGLESMAARPAVLLSYGDQKRLELAMVLALRPKLLLLDEPTAGVEAQTRRELVALIRDLCTQHGLTLLFCEHDMDAVFGISDRITVLHQGRVLVEGTPEEVQGNEQVRSVYLGSKYGAHS